MTEKISYKHLVDVVCTNYFDNYFDNEMYSATRLAGLLGYANTIESYNSVKRYIEVKHPKVYTEYFETDMEYWANKAISLEEMSND